MLNVNKLDVNFNVQLQYNINFYIIFLKQYTKLSMLSLQRNQFFSDSSKKVTQNDGCFFSKFCCCRIIKTHISIILFLNTLDNELLNILNTYGLKFYGCFYTNAKTISANIIFKKVGKTNMFSFVKISNIKFGSHIFI